MPTRNFDKKNVILLNIDENDLTSFLVDMDIDDSGNPYFMLNELANAIINVVPEYVFAYYEDPNVPQNDSVDKLREAAKSIYKIKDFDLMRRYYLDKDNSLEDDIKKMKSSNRGEFGELLLHLLLRDFKATIPLVSKVYFKDSSGVPAHGFDSVHISPKEKILWLGESKFYVNSKNGVSELIEDLLNHFKKDYLNEQFSIIKKNLNNNGIPMREEWIETLSNCNKMSDKINIINIPLLCIYPHDIYDLYTNMQDNEAITYHEGNIRELKKYFDDNNNHPFKSKLNVVLMLFPVKNKKQLAIKLHEKLWHMQNM